jgi:pilus assembly protein CpaB
MEYGAALTTENIRMVSWPATSVPAGAFQSTKALLGAETRVVLRPIEAGEPILPGKVTGPGGRASLSNLLQTDMRATTVSVSAVTGVAGFVLPGDSVDILLTRTPKVESDVAVDPVTDVLMQNVRVLAIDQINNDKTDKPKLSKTITFEVDQQGAQKLTLASSIGSLSLALRNSANQDAYLARAVGTRDLGGGDYSASIYGRPRETVMAANPFPIPAAQAAQRAAVATPVRRRPPNSVEVEIVRGTASSSYDVSRHRGY